MRGFITPVISCLLLAFLSSPLAAQNNPMPFVNDPLVPEAATPGGPGFTLTVNGAGFVSGAVVNWNDSARVTTFVSPTKLTAVILSSDIATAATVFVTVSNPSPGGGISNAVFFQVTTPTSSLAFTRTDNAYVYQEGSPLNEPTSVTVLDFTNTGVPYLAIANEECPIEAGCLMEKSTVLLAYAGVEASSQGFTGTEPLFIASGDFNGDGLLDLITLNVGTFTILLNMPGNPYFPQHVDYSYPAGAGSASTVALGDFNGDGHLDIVLPGDSGMNVFLGKGDGTFGSPANYDPATMTGFVATGDFNGDGKLDLAVSNFLANTISILLGNGDGTFQIPVDYSTGSFPANIVTADFNRDGKLDLAVVNNNATVSIFLGNGDGTFQPKVDYPAGVSINDLTIGDYNGDGILDLAVSDALCTSTCPANGSVNVLLGNGDGTFQSQLNFATGGQPASIATGEFQYSGERSGPVGRPGFATANEQNNTVSVFVAIPSGPLNPLPTISSIFPSSALLNSEAFTLTVNGTNFISGSTVYFAGQAEPTTFVSATELTAAIPAAEVSSITSVGVYVFNPAPGGGDSTSIAFNVSGPAPTISSLNPSSAVAGGPAFTLTVNGSNFVATSLVNVNGAIRVTTFLSSTQLTIAISTTDIANQGTLNISVTNPVGSGGATSSSLPLTVLASNAQPTVGGLIPASATAGGPGFTLTLSGTGFTSSSVVTFNSNVVSSAFVSATQLQAAIPASAIAVAGTPFVTVANPGGSPSLLVTFTVNNPVPAATSVSPPSVSAGNAALFASVTGSNFTTTSIVLVNGASRATTYVSSTSLSAALPASDFAHSGALSITVSNPSPGGGTTSALTLIVEDFAITSTPSSASVVAGQTASFSLMLIAANTKTANTVSFTTTGSPTGATPSFSPSTVPAGSGTTALTMTIATMPHSSTSVNTPRTRWPQGRWPYYLGVTTIIVGMGLMGLSLRFVNTSPRRFAPQLLVIALLVIAASLVACGGNSSSGSQLNTATGTPAGTYSISVVASSSTGSVTTTVMLTVM